MWDRSLNNQLIQLFVLVSTVSFIDALSSMPFVSFVADFCHKLFKTQCSLTWTASSTLRTSLNLWTNARVVQTRCGLSVTSWSFLWFFCFPFPFQKLSWLVRKLSGFLAVNRPENLCNPFWGNFMTTSGGLQILRLKFEKKIGAISRCAGWRMHGLSFFFVCASGWLPTEIVGSTFLMGHMPVIATDVVFVCLGRFQDIKHLNLRPCTISPLVPKRSNFSVPFALEFFWIFDAFFCPTGAIFTLVLLTKSLLWSFHY